MKAGVVKRDPSARDYADPVFLLILAVGLVLRFLALGQQSFWYDEAHSVGMALGGSEGSLLETVTNTHGPLYLVLLKGWMSILGESEAAVRSLSAVLGSLGLLLTYKVGIRFLGRPAALVAVALLAISPFHLWYSQEARNYALLFDLGLIAVPAFLGEMERRSAGDFIGAFIATAATCLANLSGFFLYVLYGVLSISTGRRKCYPLRRIFLFCVLSGVILWPWISGGLESTGELHVGRPDDSAGALAVKGESPPGFLSIPYALYNFSMGMTIGPSIDELKLERFSSAIDHLWYLLPGAALFAGLFLRGLVRVPRDSRWPLFLWLALPLTLMGALSVLNLKAPNSRYAFLGFAPYLLLLAAGVSSINSRTFKAVVLAAALGFMGFADYQYFTDQRYWRPDTRSAGKLLRENVGPNDAVIVYALDFPVRFYLRGEIDYVKPPGKVFKDDSSMENWLRKNTGGKNRVWVVQCQGWWVDREDRFVGLCRKTMEPKGEWQFTKAPVYLFEKTGPEETEGP